MKQNNHWVVGIPEDKEYVEPIKAWLHFELTEKDYRNMLDDIKEMNSQKRLVKATNVFKGLEGASSLGQRKANIVKSKILPSDIFRELFSESELKKIAIRYGEKYEGRGKEPKINAIIRHFEQGEYERFEGGKEKTKAIKYLEYYDKIAQRKSEEISHIFNEIKSPEDKNTERIFEEATSIIFKELLKIEGVEWMGSKKSGSAEPDGMIKMKDGIFLWDNKSTEGKYDMSGKRAIGDYAQKRKNENIWSFLVIAPDFNEKKCEKKIRELKNYYGDLDVLLVKAEDLKKTAKYWMDNKKDNKKFPVKEVFNKSGIFNPKDTCNMLKEDGYTK